MCVLIVEDVPTSRLILKSILNTLGVDDTKEVTSGNAAIRAMQERRFDMVFSEYNLGSGKNGQQLLEEARVNGLIDSSTVYFLITAETSRDMVMGAVEYQPDAYLAKPFTPISLLDRLIATMKIRQEFSAIYKAIRQEQYEKAIVLCNQKIFDSADNQVQALRLKAEAMLGLKRYDAAESVYRQVLVIKEQLWAMLGIGKALYLTNQSAQAVRQFRDVLQSYPEAVEAYGWLAKVLESEGKKDLAQEALERAVSMSPNAVPRLVELGRLAAENKSWHIAEKAYRSSVSLAYESCFKSPDNYLELANALQMKLDDTKSDESTDALKDVTNILHQVRTEYKGDASIDFKATILEVMSHVASGNSDIANEKIDRAESLYVEFDNQEKVDHCNRLITGLAATGNHEHALDIVEQIDDADLDCKDLVDELRSQVSHIQEDNHYEMLNKRGIKAYRSGNTIESFHLFRKSAEREGANYSVILNVIQSCLDLVELDAVPTENWPDECQTYFNKLAGISRKDSRFERFTVLKQTFKELSQR